METLSIPQVQDGSVIHAECIRRRPRRVKRTKSFKATLRNITGYAKQDFKLFFVNKNTWNVKTAYTRLHLLGEKFRSVALNMAHLRYLNL